MKKTEITKDNLDSLLNWLDSEEEIAARKYELMRRRLIQFFHGRGCNSAEELADETINRAAEKTKEISAAYEGEPAAYFHAVARNVFREFLKIPKAEELPKRLAEKRTETDEVSELRHQCLDNCLAKLPADQSQLIIAYFKGEKQEKIKQRKKLSDLLGISSQALRVRATRIKQDLRKCVFDCVREKKSLKRFS